MVWHNAEMEDPLKSGEYLVATIYDGMNWYELAVYDADEERWTSAFEGTLWGEIVWWTDLPAIPKE